MLSRPSYPGISIGAVVRLPLSPAEVERGRRLGVALRRARGTRSMLTTAVDAGVSPETIRKIESGRVATPAFSTIAAIAAVLDLSLDALWAEVNRSDGEPGPAGTTPRAGARLVS